MAFNAKYGLQFDPFSQLNAMNPLPPMQTNLGSDKALALNDISGFMKTLSPKQQKTFNQLQQGYGISSNTLNGSQGNINPGSNQEQFFNALGAQGINLPTNDVSKGILNQGYYQGQIGQLNGQELNAPIRVARDPNTDQPLFGDFASQLDQRQGLMSAGAGQLRQQISSQFANFVEQNQANQAMQGVQMNGLGRLQLQQRLRRQYGPGFMEIPAARQLMDQFDAQIAQEEDIGAITKALAQGQTALSFLAPNKYAVDPGTFMPRIQAPTAPTMGQTDTNPKTYSPTNVDVGMRTSGGLVQ
jgi:hypothetical protein